ncbi:helix-turn-helix transcriptional regulator [Agromyces sp. LHK192]|uniref:helix-turn-helix transcriptional regulator n=1 Tax=Agromyces sp. LHK192 TaxID=2498704 RepID=UPI0021067650|nr:helix-turn-helix transcriptional regulator [Agromyces sp. LHK192]
MLRGRREALQPEDVGLERGPGRRATGLRRAEAAELCRMSADYLSRLEQQRGPHPSPRMLASIAAGLRFSTEERDELFRAAGVEPPRHGSGRAHVDIGLRTVFERLGDVPAVIRTGLGETIRQSSLAVAVFGDESGFRREDRSLVYRWFLHPEVRERYAPEDRVGLGREFVDRLRSATDGPAAAPAGSLVRLLHRASTEFAGLWAEATGVGAQRSAPRSRIVRVEHPDVGRIVLRRQVLRDEAEDHDLIVFTAAAGSIDADRLRTLGERTRT